MLGDGNEYVWGLGLIGQITGSSVATYTHADGLGSIRVLTDGSGANVGTQAYDAFGATRSQSGVQFPFTYTGQQVDPESGLVYLRARYMDPAQGRFQTKDLITGWTISPQTLHRYTYTRNNSPNLVDPTGLCGWTDPWNCIDEVDDGASWAWDYATDSPTNMIQLLDLVPVVEACTGVVSATGFTTVEILPACVGIEDIIGLASAYLTQLQIDRSDCSSLRKSMATVINLGNLALDIGMPLAQEAAELAFYALSAQLLNCAVTPAQPEDQRVQSPTKACS